MLSIIIPVKNEPLINKLVEKLNSIILLPHEIIIIDKSFPPLNYIEGAKIIRQASNGLGNAFVEGLSVAKGDIVALMDGDFSHDPSDLLKLLSHTKEADIVIGSKRAPDAKDYDRSSRKIVSILLSSFMRIFLGLSIKDVMSGFMVIKRSSLEHISLRPKGYKVVMEILYKSKKFKLKVKEVPITFHKRTEGKSKVGFNINGLKELFNIITFAIELRLGIR